MKQFSVGSFSDIYSINEFGRRLWDLLNNDKIVLKMETATALRRPAIEGIVDDLIKFVDNGIWSDRQKQMCGAMVRQVMEMNGYELDRTGVRITSTELFFSAARYKKSRPALKKETEVHETNIIWVSGEPDTSKERTLLGLKKSFLEKVLENLHSASGVQFGQTGDGIAPNYQTISINGDKKTFIGRDHEQHKSLSFDDNNLSRVFSRAEIEKIYQSKL